jgi:UDP-N-acetylglucosamine pyrophosphorylase
LSARYKLCKVFQGGRCGAHREIENVGYGLVMSSTNKSALPAHSRDEFEAKMREAGLSAAAIRSFVHNYDLLAAGQTGMVPEAEIEPVVELPRLEQIAGESVPEPTLLAETVVVKLNGGLGTSMGLERAKSLLEVKNGLTFLDFIVRQVLHLRAQFDVPLRFLLMNSYSTSADTRTFLGRYGELGDPAGVELMQNRVPKVDATTLRPIRWPENPQLEWCPPGHGDLYPSLMGSGWLDRLLDDGVKFLFVSNSDNLGATVDLALLQYFAGSGHPFLMEVAERTPSDRKGGHLARRHDGRLILRESAQCPPADVAAFQDIRRHRFFNTNSLWVRLDHLRRLLEEAGGFLPLPMIKNAKTIDPRRADSPAVFQLETAMGAAIECFEGAAAVVVPRSRFAPVKTTSDLFALRSDAYVVTADWQVTLAPECEGVPPAIALDADHYKLVDQLDARTAGGVPSLKRCRELTVRGPVSFDGNSTLVGTVTIENPGDRVAPLPAGEYRDKTVRLGNN